MNAEPAHMVEVDHLTHRYGARTALSDVVFDVSAGRMLALLGPNGSGKSTLFRILSTLLTPSEGTARIAGMDVVSRREDVRRHIGVVFQHPSLDGELTVMENMLYQGNLYGLSGAALRRRCNELIDRVQVADRAGDRVAKLSGGLRRRVELAKGLLHGPRVLLMDEPSTGLDPAARANLMRHLHALRDEAGVTMILTTHLMDEAEQCDTVAVLDAGRLVASGKPGALKSEIGGDVVTIACAAPDALGRKIHERFRVEVRVVGGALHVERDGGHAFVPELVAAFPDEIDSVTVGKPTLEDVFLHVTGHGFAEERATRGGKGAA
jgi:ABC-2 type transport system ATP-binding protein